MLRSIVSVLVLAFVAAAASAAPRWNGAGWYQIEDVIEYGWIVAGPFEGKDACEATLPANDEISKFYCEYLAAKPNWDN